MASTSEYKATQKVIAAISDWMAIGGVPTQVKFAKGSVVAGNTGEIVAAVPGKKIRVLHERTTCDGAGTATWKSGSTAITGVHDLTEGLTDSYDRGLFETAAGAALNLTAATSNFDTTITYVEV